MDEAGEGAADWSRERFSGLAWPVLLAPLLVKLNEDESREMDNRASPLNAEVERRDLIEPAGSS